MELFRELIRTEVYPKTKCQVCDYDSCFVSFLEPYIRVFHRMCFSIACGLTRHTIQNHRFWWCFLLLSKCSQVWCLCGWDLVYEDNRFQSKPKWKSKMQCLRSKTFLFWSNRTNYLWTHTQEQGRSLFCLRKKCIVDKYTRDWVAFKFWFLLPEFL